MGGRGRCWAGLSPSPILPSAPLETLPLLGRGRRRPPQEGRRRRRRRDLEFPSAAAVAAAAPKPRRGHRPELWWRLRVAVVSAALFTAQATETSWPRRTEPGIKLRPAEVSRARGAPPRPHPLAAYLQVRSSTLDPQSPAKHVPKAPRHAGEQESTRPIRS